MLSNDLTITYAGVSKALVRINQDSYGATYWGESGLNEFKLTIKHTIPPRGKSGESHMIRLDVARKDAEGIYLGTTSAWTVVKSMDSIQDLTTALNIAAALLAFAVSDSGNTVSVINRVVGRES